MKAPGGQRKPLHLPLDEAGHRAHDYRRLIARWRAIARAAGLGLRKFAQAGDYPCYYLQTPGPARDGGLYVSAGIHGDEPAGPEALAHWAETRLPALLRRRPALPLLLFPCLNPWGLVNNRRTDAKGVDLNRVFYRTAFSPVAELTRLVHGGDVSPVGELKKLIAGRRFGACVALHEDYDGQGFYVYETSRHGRDDWGEALLEAGARVLPVDGRRRIDGRAFKGGLLRRRSGLEKESVNPESIYLYLGYTDHAFTLETPSEFSLARRVEAIGVLLDECVRRLLAQRRRG